LGKKERKEKVIEGGGDRAMGPPVEGEKEKRTIRRRDMQMRRITIYLRFT